MPNSLEIEGTSHIRRQTQTEEAIQRMTGKRVVQVHYARSETGNPSLRSYIVIHLEDGTVVTFDAISVSAGEERYELPQASLGTPGDS